MKRVFSVFLAAASIFAFMLIYAQGFFDEMNGSILRFHIIANSDSSYDRAVKLDVRDYVSAAMADCGIEPDSAEYLSKIEMLANERLGEIDAAYSARAAKTHVYIPRKQYKNITLPAGRYNAVRLVLGEGRGENWWCVAYPSLCFSESTGGELSQQAKDKLSERISDSSMDIITNDAQYSFWVVDFVGKLLK